MVESRGSAGCLRCAGAVRGTPQRQLHGNGVISPALISVAHMALHGSCGDRDKRADRNRAPERERERGREKKHESEREREGEEGERERERERQMFEAESVEKQRAGICHKALTVPLHCQTDT